MTLTLDDFTAFHSAVHKWPPFAWQTRLLAQIHEERAWPAVLDLPTGSGKTTCIDIALFALALDAAADPQQRWCPRRIAMVVDRRIVVDQVAERGRKLLRALVDPNASPVVTAVAQRLRSLHREADGPLRVFTLRGGIPKDDGWARTPDQPLILASTVDQIGSRLMVQGYGVTRGMRPVHAGLLGNDLLLLLDEVHLSQPFAETLDALDRMRQGLADGPLPRRYHHAFLSATPGAADVEPFGLLEEEKQQDSPLGPRLHAAKPTRLVEAQDATAVEKSCIDHARKLIARHDVIAVVVNRVARAATIVRQLGEILKGEADVRLLTGRMRPLDRDDVLAELKPRIMTGRGRDSVERKLVVVGTQCIEAGADFDFDAMVSEAASFDALRQRFGRVDRLGLYGSAEGVIVYDKSTGKDDPVYGQALKATWQWIKKKRTKRTRQINLGVLSCPEPTAEVLPDLVAPKTHAPALLRAYLDLWMQTSPAPVVVPDVGLWLHGPQAGPADVQVVWRVDLDEEHLQPGDADLATQIVAAIRPSSLEAISVPFVAARRWLQEEDAGDIADVEGVARDARPGSGGRPALRWNGNKSEVVLPDKIRPGDTIIVPANYGGIRDKCFDGRFSVEVTDLAERAALLGRGQPMLRLHPDTLKQLQMSLPVEDPAEAREVLVALADEEPAGWRKLLLSGLAGSSKAIVVDAKKPWNILQGRRIEASRLRESLELGDSVEDGAELTTDEEDSFHTGRAVPLSVHCTDVERYARDYAQRLGFGPDLAEDIALAGWLHDVGKADRRFQLMLRGGSEIDLFKDETLWAKSGMPRGAKAAHRRAQMRSGYPKRARHEVQSLAMLDHNMDVLRAKAHDIDLVLHLVTSHHGHCRPFAPAVADDAPVEVVLAGHHSKAFGTIAFGATSSRHELYRLDSPLADRFWMLVQRYGWLDLCWLEAILRLADQRASQMEEEATDATRGD